MGRRWRVSWGSYIPELIGVAVLAAVGLWYYALR